MEATLSSKNQVNIPRQVREHLHLKAGDRFKFFMLLDGTVVLLLKGPITALKGSVLKLRKPVSIEQINTAIATEATRRNRN